MQQLSRQPAFELGQVVATPGALAVLKKSGQQPGEFLTRHVNREWGDLSDEDRKENDHSLEHGFRLLSSLMIRRILVLFPGAMNDKGRYRQSCKK
jgi:hypothetical protein